MEGVPIGRTDSAEELAKMNSGANYVITLENYQADWHPNNKVAPAANDLLMEHYEMVYVLEGNHNNEILDHKVGKEL